MKRIIFALLFATLPGVTLGQSQASAYQPDFSDIEVYQPLIWNPKLVTSDYAMSPADLVIIVNATAGAAITLPGPCAAGWTRMVVNATAFFQADGTTPTPSVTVQPFAGDNWIANVTTTSGPRSSPLTLNSGMVQKFRAIGSAGVCIGWALSN